MVPAVVGVASGGGGASAGGAPPTASLVVIACADRDSAVLSRSPAPPTEVNRYERNPGFLASVVAAVFVVGSVEDAAVAGSAPPTASLVVIGCVDAVAATGSAPPTAWLALYFECLASQYRYRSWMAIMAACCCSLVGGVKLSISGGGAGVDGAGLGSGDSIRLPGTSVGSSCGKAVARVAMRPTVTAKESFMMLESSGLGSEVESATGVW